MWLSLQNTLPENIRNNEHAQAGRVAVFSALNGLRGRLKALD